MSKSLQFSIQFAVLARPFSIFVLTTLLLSIQFAASPDLALAQSDTKNQAPNFEIQDQDPNAQPANPTVNPNSAGAQEPAAAEDPLADRPAWKAYMETTNERRRLVAQMDKLIASSPIGFPELQQEHNRKVAAMRAQRDMLANKLNDLALDAFVESPMSDQDLAMNAIRRLSASLDPKTMNSKFDPELANRLAVVFNNSEMANAKTLFYGFRAAYALHDFETAEKNLNAIKEKGATLNQLIWDRLNQTKEKWNRELEIRRMEASTDDLPRVKFETTEGEFVVELFENHAPETVANFISLVEKGFYDGLKFHMVVPGVLIQSGSPTGDQTGHPGYTIACESYRDQIRHHFMGTISMANKGKDTGGSQFYFAQQPNPNLDGKYTVFGRIIENLPVIFDVKRLDRPSTVVAPNEASLINKVTVIRKRNHPYKPNILKTIPKPGEEGSSTTNPLPSTTPAEGSTTKPAAPAAQGSGSK